jgi:hypothetical protein
VLFALATAYETSAWAANQFFLSIVWSSQISEGAEPPLSGVARIDSGSGLIIRAQAMFSDGRIAFLGDQITPKADSQVLLVDAERAGPESALVLNLVGRPCIGTVGLLSALISGQIANRKPYVSALTIGAGGDVFVGGVCNTFLDEASSRHSDAYLARLDSAGRLRWERTYGHDGTMSIKDVALTSSGDLAVVGQDGSNGWLARIAFNGSLMWQRNLGNDLDIAVASLPDDRLAVAGFKGMEVYTWIVDKSGHTVATTRTRGPIGQPRSSFGRVAIAATPDAVYVVSLWDYSFHAQPVAVAKLRLDGELLWNTVLSDTIQAETNRAVPLSRTCSPALAVAPDGSVLIACALENQIQLYRLDASFGAEQENRIPLPDCQAGHPAALFLTIRDDRTALLSGSRPSSNVGSNCTWLGRLTISQ